MTDVQTLFIIIEYRPIRYTSTAANEVRKEAQQLATQREQESENETTRCTINCCGRPMCSKSESCDVCVELVDEVLVAVGAGA